MLEIKLPLRLNIVDGQADPRTVTLYGPKVTLGRAPENAIAVPSSYMSRCHGEFLLHDRGWLYRDLGSTNGTRIQQHGGEIFLNRYTGTHEVLLKGGEWLRIGEVVIEVMGSLPPRSTPDGAVIRSTCSTRQALSLLMEPGVQEDSPLRVLFDTVRRISACSDEEQVMATVSEIILDLAPSVTHVFLFDAGSDGEGDWQRRWYWPPKKGEAEPSFSKTLLQYAIMCGDSIQYSSREPGFPLSTSLTESMIFSSICVPLRGRQGYLGVLEVDRRGSAEEFTERDLHVLTLLGGQLAAMFDRFRTSRQIQRMFEGFVEASVKAIESRDPPTAGHSSRVADYCLHIADVISRSEKGPFKEVRFGKTDLRVLYYAALLHDFGKVGVKEDVLGKAHKLTETQLVDIRGRFKLAAMEARARRAEEKIALLKKWADSAPGVGQGETSDSRDQALEGQDNPESASGGGQGDIPAGPEMTLEGIDKALEKDLAWLEGEERWLQSQMSARPVPVQEIPRLRRLTQPYGSVCLLEPAELEVMLNCRGTLTAEELKQIESHPVLSRNYLEIIPWPDELKRIPEVAASHHEKLNGRGYPAGLRDERIPLLVRILAVSDVFDALTAADRPYRGAMSREKALEILRSEVESGALDPDVLRALEAALEEMDEEHLQATTYRMRIL